MLRQGSLAGGRGQEECPMEITKEPYCWMLARGPRKSSSAWKAERAHLESLQAQLLAGPGQDKDNMM